MSNLFPEKASAESLRLETAVHIVAAYVSNNAVPAAELPLLIQDIYSNISKIASGVPEQVAEAPHEPAVPVKKSITNDFIICLEDGKKFKSLRRHLMAAFGMTPAEYRTKWSLPHDYPMVAPAYSSVRSSLARGAGLGQKLVGTAVEKSIDVTIENLAGGAPATDASEKNAAEATKEPVTKVTGDAALAVAEEPAAEAITEAPSGVAVKSRTVAVKKSAAVAARPPPSSIVRKPTANKLVAKKVTAKKAAKRPAAAGKSAVKKSVAKKAAAKPARKKTG